MDTRSRSREDLLEDGTFVMRDGLWGNDVPKSERTTDSNRSDSSNSAKLGSNAIVPAGIGTRGSNRASGSGLSVASGGGATSSGGMHHGGRSSDDDEEDELPLLCSNNGSNMKPMGMLGMSRTSSAASFASGELEPPGHLYSSYSTAAVNAKRSSGSSGQATVFGRFYARVYNRIFRPRRSSKAPEKNGPSSSSATGASSSTMRVASSMEHSKQLPPFVVSPNSWWYTTFHHVTVILSLVLGIIVPFNVAFLNAEKLFSAVNCFVYATDLLFQGDLVLTFFVARFEMGEWRTNHLDIAESYFSDGFTYDATACIPWDLCAKLFLFPLVAAAFGSFRIDLVAVALSTPGLIRLLRLKRLWDALYHAGADFKHSYFWICTLKFVLMTLFAAHWAACGFFLLARLESFESETWVARTSPGLPAKGPFTAYVTSIYWAVTTLSTTGYGDLSAFTNPERIWTALFMLFNLALTAYVLGNMTVLLTKADAQRAAFHDRLAAMNKYMRANHIPDPLTHQVRSHLKLQFETSEIQDDILSHCPPTVRMHITRFVYSKFVDMPYLFKGTSDIFKDQITNNLRTEFFLPNIAIINPGDNISEMFIVASGTAEVVVRSEEGDDEVWLELREGDCVCEFAFLCDVTQMWTVRTTSVCRMLAVNEENYRKIAKNNPADERRVLLNLLERAKLMVDTTRIMPSSSGGSTGMTKDVSVGNGGGGARSIADMAKLLRQEVETFLSRQAQEAVMSLCYAAKRGDMLDMFRLAAGGFNLNQSDYDGRTPLHLAAANGQDEVVEFILSTGADCNPKDCFHRTPLQEAVSGGHTSTAVILRRHGGELQLLHEGMHMCRLAAQGNALQLKSLIEFGASANAADYDGRAALQIAAAEGHLNVVKVLVAGNADPHHKDRWDRTAADEAQLNGHSSIVAFLQSLPKQRPSS